MTLLKFLTVFTSMMIMSLLTFGCANDQLSQMIGAGTEPSVDLDGSSWRLRAFQSAQGQVEVLPDTEVTLEFSSGNIAGSAGCNRFMGMYTLEAKTQLTINLGGITMMACPEVIMEQESAFLEALSLAQQVIWTEDSLTIVYGTDNTLILDRI